MLPPLDSRLLRALTLDERIELGLARAVDGAATLTDDLLGVAIDGWATPLGADAIDLLRARLEVAGIGGAELGRLLVLDEEALADAVGAAGGPPEWHGALLEALTPPSAAVTARLAAALGEVCEAEQQLVAVEPFVARALDCVRSDSPGGSAEADRLAGDLLRPLRHRLLELLQRPVAIELHAARLRGELTAPTPEGRYEQHLVLLGTPDGRAAFLAEYPPLARAAWTWTKQWVENSVELLRRCVDDRPELELVFGELGDVARLESADSDPHNGGRHVWFVTFASGTRLVYKPRPFAVEHAFQELVQRLVDAGLRPPLRAVRVVDRGTHGWMEFVEAEECRTADELTDFHRRLGAWLGILHALVATDVHNENIVAAGAHPLPVDHETVLRGREYEWHGDDVREAVVRAIADSLLGTHLLAAPRWADDLGRMVDHSGMGAAFDDVGRQPVARMVGVGTDDVRLGWGEEEVAGKLNRARHAGTAVDSRDFHAAIDEGLVRALDLLVGDDAHVDGLLEPFRGAVVRMVLRPTKHYFEFLEDLHHPIYLGDALDQVLVEARMCDRYPGSSWRREVLASELAQLAVGDIPYFSSRLGTHDLLGGDGLVASGAVLADGLEAARDRLTELRAPSAVQRQRWVLAVATAGGEGRARIDVPLAGASPVELATEVGDLLLASSVRDGDHSHATWIGAVETGDPATDRHVYIPRPVGVELYDGLAGIAVFLAELAAATGAARFGDLADAAVATLLEDLDNVAPPIIGGYEGWGGRIGALVRLAELRGHDDLLDRAERGAQQLLALVDDDTTFDVIAGAAGAIVPLLQLEVERPGSVALQAARRCGEHLAGALVPGPGLRFTRGFSHGLAGPAWSLAWLHDRTGDPQWRDLALTLAARERARFDEAFADDDMPGRSRMSAWCHGPVGIAMSRLEAWRLLGDDDLHDDAVRALEAARVAAPMRAHCPCHGALGNLERFACAAEVLGDDSASAAHAAELGRIVTDLRTHGIRHANVGDFPMPGLLTGIAGVGHGLLRAALPEQVPSVLVPRVRVRG